MSLCRIAGMVLVVVLNPAGAAFGVEPVNPNLSTSAREVLNYLDSVYQKKVLAGYNVYVHTPDDYEQTGKHAAVWARDIRWLGDAAEVIRDARQRRYILTLHWHWFFDGDSAWQGKRKTPVDVGRLATPGTPEHTRALAEMNAAADTLQLLEDADIPVLWRPLHEIDGGWFWWTDKDHPENTARLWRMMYDLFTRTRGLDNLIWVYSAGVGKKTVAERQRFYPGAAYVDIAGIDIYGVNVRTEAQKYWDYYNAMTQVAPGKMLACSECDAIPDPQRMQEGTLPKWLYALPWWGTPDNRRPFDWALYTMRNEFIVTLDELPPLGQGNIAPEIGMLQPLDDGSAWYPDTRPVINVSAVDRGGRIQHVEFWADGAPIGALVSPPYTFSWANAPTGCHDLTAVAVDDTGVRTTSNRVRITIGLVDLARGRPVTVSSGKNSEQAVDGNYHSAWSSDKSDDEWICVDLGAVHTIDRVNLLWGWKIHAADFSLDVARNSPDDPQNWTTVYSKKDRPYVTWEATDRLTFAPTAARYVRLHATRRAGRQTWGGYQLTALEVPVPAPAGR
jgi:mannan endo-1,4-beta-mannosidase